MYNLILNIIAFISLLVGFVGVIFSPVWLVIGLVSFFVSIVLSEVILCFTDE